MVRECQRGGRCETWVGAKDERDDEMLVRRQMCLQAALIAKMRHEMEMRAAGQWKQKHYQTTQQEEKQSGSPESGQQRLLRRGK